MRNAVASTSTTTTTTTAKTRSMFSLGSLFRHLVVISISSLTAFAVYRNNSYTKDPLTYFIPNLLLFTPFKDLTKLAWDYVIRVDRTITYERKPVPELLAEEWSYDAIRNITNNFRNPAVVRGMFANTTGVLNWSKPGYLSSILGDFVIPSPEEAYHDMNVFNYQAVTFRDAYEGILANPKDPRYLFFPIPNKPSHDLLSPEERKNITNVVNKLCRDDLDYDRFWPGFGTESHEAYFRSSIIAGNGQDADKGEKTTGSFWHAAMANNWFIQVVGEKEWEFLGPEYTAYMKPKRLGLIYVIAGGKDILDYMHHLPVQYTTLYPGDLLYNPEWMWHYIQNKPGLAVGIPIRERNGTRAIEHNMHLSLVSIVNLYLDKIFGIRYGLEE